MTNTSPRRVVALLCTAEVLSMTGFSVYPALLPMLRAVWKLNNSEAGFVGGVFFGGYMAAVPVLASLTDRTDARHVYLGSTLLASLGAIGFALFANGLWAAALCQGLIGAGLAGTYMPGLKALSDHIEGPRLSRSVAFYTSTFAIGASLSLVLTGLIAAAWGWRWAFGLSAIGPLLAGALVVRGLPPQALLPHPRHAGAPATALLDLRPVLRNREAAGYIAGYAAHCWELFGLRSWLVAFLVFNRQMPWLPANVAAAINLLGPGASIIGNEFAGRFGRRRVIVAVMTVSVLLACTVGFTARLPWLPLVLLVSLYYVAIVADSAALTSGLVEAADYRQRGATMALHSFLGFGAGFLAPIVFGVVLDVAGGSASLLGWGFAFASLGAGGAIGPIAMRRFRQPREQVAGVS